MDTKIYCYILWQMLCHVLWHVTCLGRCCCHVVCGRYYNHQADGIACIKIKSQTPTKKKYRSNNKHAGHNNQNNQNVYMVVPYYKGLSESIKRSCRKYGVQAHFKGGLTIKNLLMAPKDKDPILK